MAEKTSQMSVITNFPKDPVEMFKNLLARLETSYITMNLATIDSEFGVLNRTVVYRGLVDDAVAFVTEKNSRKYENLKSNPKLGLTFLFPEVSSANKTEVWQVRLIDAEAVELNAEQIAKFWSEEHLFAKIRSHISDCGKPINHEELQQKHDQLLIEYKAGHNKLEQTKTYTAFKIEPKRWDFYKSHDNEIADRLQYRQCADNPKDWEILHVAP